MKKSPSRSALLEIGVEEIPARFIDPAIAQLRALTESGLSEAGVSYETIETFGSPRRLVVLISGLALKAADRHDEVIGPPLKAAKNEKGEWTAAATGFARAQDVPVSALVLKTTPKGERYVAERFTKGGPTEQVLRALYPALVERLSFPKTMVWNETDFRFARPIRWFIALYGTKVIRFRLAGVTSGQTSVGLLALGAPKIQVPKPERYKAILQNRCIIIDPADRRKRIQTQVDALAKRVKAKPVMTEEHLTEVVHLTEYPTCILGHFPESYLALPREVLVSVLRRHQKFFPLEVSRRQLTNAFVGVRNGPTDSESVVREGYERVLNARLSDAKFFFDQDVKIPLGSFAERLGEIGFLEKAGTMADKSVRVRRLATTLGESVQASADARTAAAEAAGLAKADLLTQMVSEFPELQGVAGRFYAQAQALPENVALAIEEHYRPLTAEGDLPKSESGALLAVADKLDSLAAYMFSGHAPTGSADPYGMRRLSTGVIRIVLERGWALSWSDLISLAWDFPLYEKAAQEKESFAVFFRQRLESWFENQGYRRDEIGAVLSNPHQPLPNLLAKLVGLKTVRNRPEFGALAAGIKRARNVLRQAEEKGFLPSENGGLTLDMLPHAAEQALLRSVHSVQDAFQQALGAGQFKEALLMLAPLKKPIDDFFDGVMVMSDNVDERARRLRLLQSVERLFSSLVDFSCLQETPAVSQHES